MIQASELKERFTRLVSTPVSVAEYNEDGESVSLLFENDWVRILLIRQNGDTNVTIEVESSIPKNERSTSDTGKLTLNGALNHLYYLQALGDNGFTLEVIRQDCLWTATKTFGTEIDIAVFEKLCPPAVETKLSTAPRR